MHIQTVNSTSGNQIAQLLEDCWADQRRATVAFVQELAVGPESEPILGDAHAQRSNLAVDRVLLGLLFR